MDKTIRRTPKQNATLYLLMNKLGITADMKDDMVYHATGGRTTHTSEMTKEEADNLIDSLKKEVLKSLKHHQCDHMRKKIIAKFIEMGYTTPEGKADMPRIYAWVEKYGYLHKPLNKYTYNELPMLVSQAEKYYYQFLESVAR